MKYVAPSIDERSFTCPHCGVLARQEKWGHSTDGPAHNYFGEGNLRASGIQISRCENCSKNCFWVQGIYVFPPASGAPPPNPEMPLDVLGDYEEASRICTDSPRGAAALLRLGVQKLMKHLGEPGGNINQDIAALVAKGLPLQIQQALDVVRVTGNNAVHPGQLDANDIQIAQQLFPLLNLIVEYQISMPARVAAIYESLPAGAREGIAKRDAAK